MSHLSYGKQQEQFKVTWNDVGVVFAAILAVTHDLWAGFLEWAPHAAQGMILIATVIYVIARAAIEVKRFIKGDKHHDS